MDEEQLNKLKYVAWFDRTTVTSIITEDAARRILRFEKENGSITAAMIKKMEDSK